MSFSATATTMTIVTEYLSPYQIKQESGELSGFSVEVVRAMFAELNEVPNILVMPWARAYQIALRDENVMIFSMAKTPQRKAAFKWVGDLFEERLYFWQLTSKDTAKQNNVSSLINHKVAASRNSNVAQYLVDKGFNEAHFSTTEDQNMQMLYSNRVDFIVATELMVKQRAKRLGFDETRLVKVFEVPELNNFLSIAFSNKTDDSLVKQYKSAFEKVKAKGLLKQLKHKWLTVE